MELKDKVRIAKDYLNISTVLFDKDKNKKDEALHYLYKAQIVLEGFKKKTGIHHPLTEVIQSRMSHLQSI